MATTSQLRTSYPEFIKRWPTASLGPLCDFTKAVPVAFPAGGSAYPSGRVVLRVHPSTQQIWRAVAAIMVLYGYQFRETAGGTLSCRRITGGTGTTLHAHGIAGDWNPSKNAYRLTSGGGLIQWGRQTDMPAAMVEAIERIKLANGRHPIRWGGRWYSIKDPMHYELAELQKDLAPVNLASLPAGAWTKYLAFEQSTQPIGDPMLDFVIGPLAADSVGGPEGDPVGDQAETLQRMLIDRGFPLPKYGPDRYAGDETRHALRAFQATKAGVSTSSAEYTGGKVGPKTYAAFNKPDGSGAGGDHPDTDHATLAPKTSVDTLIAAVRSELDSHAKARASASVHPHAHDEGTTGPAK